VDRGRFQQPYTLSNGKKVYLSPRAVDPYGPSGNPYKSGILGGGGEWNSDTGQFDKKSNTLEKVTLGAALAPFAAAAIPAFGGGAAGAGGGMPALSSPASVLPSGGGGMLLDSGGAALLGSGAGASVPAAAAVKTAAPKVASTGAKSVLDKSILGGLSTKQLGAIGLLAQQLFKGKPKSSTVNSPSMTSLQSLLDLQTAQARRQDPLHRAVTQLATNLLPNSAFGAGPGRPAIE
jgi:hypothetical protein